MSIVLHENRVGKTYIIAPMCIFFLFVLLGIIGYIVTAELNALMFMAILGSSVPITIWYRDYIRNPMGIEIQEDGIVAVFRNGSSEFIPWKRFKSIAYWPGDQTKFGLAKTSRGDYLLVGKSMPYLLNNHLGKEIREAYSRNMGKYPPMR